MADNPIITGKYHVPKPDAPDRPDPPSDLPYLQTWAKAVASKPTTGVMDPDTGVAGGSQVIKTGTPTPEVSPAAASYDAAQNTVARLERELAELQNQASGADADDPVFTQIEDKQIELTNARGMLSAEASAYKTEDVPSVAEATGKAISTPSALLSQSTIYGLTVETDQLIGEGVGETKDLASLITTTAQTSEGAADPKIKKVAAYLNSIPPEERKEKYPDIKTYALQLKEERGGDSTWLVPNPKSIKYYYIPENRVGKIDPVTGESVRVTEVTDLTPQEIEERGFNSGDGYYILEYTNALDNVTFNYGQNQKIRNWSDASANFNEELTKQYRDHLGYDSPAQFYEAQAAEMERDALTDTASTYDAILSQPKVKAALETFAAATGTPSDEAQMTAETMDAEDLAQLDLDAETLDVIRQIPQIKRSLEAGETPTAALFDEYTASEAARLEGVTPEAEAARFEGEAPEVTAETDYALGNIPAVEREVTEEELAQAMGDDLNPEQAQAAKVAYEARLAFAKGEITEEQLGKAITDYVAVKTEQASRDVTAEEIAKAQGLGLTAEQAQNVTSNYQPDITAQTDEVAQNELADAQTNYNLGTPDAATLTPTEIEDAAKAEEIPQAGDVETTYQSVIDAAKGDVDTQNEIIDADKIVVAETISVVGATMDKLNDQAVTAVVQGTFSQELEAVAAQGTVSELSTVQGQMAKLLDQFNDGTPAWAAGAMRAANAAMAARGLGGSSMAGAAIIQAAMESAYPIAQADAQVFAAMDMQNLANRQQVALTNAAAKNNMQLQNLSMAQQKALQDSSNAFALQTQSLSNTQAAVLAEAQFKYGLQEKTIDVNMQSALANAARFAEVNNINLTNSQQALLQMSSENLSVEMANLSNKQQTALSNLQVRAAISGQELTNAQQVAMLSSTQMFEAAQFSATAKQEAFMQDFQARAALEGQVLGNRQQTQLFNAARYAELNDINLSNEQQVALQKSVQSLDVEMANLSNRQQTELTNAQMRAALQGKVLDNQQQAEVLRAARYAEVNDINLSNTQQAFVQDAMIKAAAENKVLDNKQQTMLFNAARFADVHDLSLTNEQQALVLQSTQLSDIAIQDASNFQQTELANAQLRAALQGKVLDNKQQAEFMRATAYAEANNLTVSNKQMAVVQEFVSNSTMQGKVLDNRQQAAIFNVSAVLEERQIELSNQQQTTLFNTTNKLTVSMEEMSNRQQTALANAQIEAAMKGQELSNQQQVNVIKAERIAEIANLNFTAAQSRALQNAQLAQTVDLANLSNKQAKLMADVASMAQLDMANLNNRQQAAAQQAQAFLQMDMANLDNEQQAVMFEAQSLVQSILSDQAAENAQLQFNAESITQVNQFYDSLSSSVEQFNIAQANAMEQFNAGEANAIEKFEAELANERDIFNAQNELVIAQANTVWRQSVATANTAALNEANMSEVMAANNLTMQGLAELWQQERDLMNFAWSSAENQLGRDHELVVAKLRADSEEDAAYSNSAGNFLSTLVSAYFKYG